MLMNTSCTMSSPASRLRTNSAASRTSSRWCWRNNSVRSAVPHPIPENAPPAAAADARDGRSSSSAVMSALQVAAATAHRQVVNGSRNLYAPSAAWLLARSNNSAAARLPVFTRGRGEAWEQPPGRLTPARVRRGLRNVRATSVRPAGAPATPKVSGTKETG